MGVTALQQTTRGRRFHHSVGLFVYWLLVQRPVKTGQRSGDTSNARCAGREKVSAFRSVKRNNSLGAQVPVRG